VQESDKNGGNGGKMSEDSWKEGLPFSATYSRMMGHSGGRARRCKGKRDNFRIRMKLKVKEGEGFWQNEEGGSQEFSQGKVREAQEKKRNEG